MKTKLELEIKKGIKPGPFEGINFLIYSTKEQFDENDLEKIVKHLKMWRLHTTNNLVEVEFTEARQNEGKTLFGLTMKYPDLFLNKQQVIDIINQVSENFSSFLDQRIKDLEQALIVRKSHTDQQ